MPWIRRTKPKHKCERPELHRVRRGRTEPLAAAGDLWLCPKCGTTWQVEAVFPVGAGFLGPEGFSESSDWHLTWMRI